MSSRLHHRPALIVALEAHPPSAGTVAVPLLGTAVAVGLAELYSEIAGTETRTRARLGRRQIFELLDEVGAVGLGIAFPAAFFALARSGCSTSTLPSPSPNGPGSP